MEKQCVNKQRDKRQAPQQSMHQQAGYVQRSLAQLTAQAQAHYSSFSQIGLYLSCCNNNSHTERIDLLQINYTNISSIVRI
jgi:hypothetical protein